MEKNHIRSNDSVWFRRSNSLRNHNEETYRIETAVKTIPFHSIPEGSENSSSPDMSMDEKQ